MENLSKGIKETAKEEIDLMKPKTKKIKKYNDKVESLSKEPKEIILKVENAEDLENIIELKKKRNNVQKVIKREQKQIENSKNEIINSKHDYKHFKAIKYARNLQTKQNNIVHDKTGKIVVNPEKQYTIVKQHFQKQFYDASKINIQRFIGNPKFLNTRITIEEIKNVLKNSNNNKAAGSNEMQMELIKCSPDCILIKICSNLNSIMENHVNEINLEHSILLPIQKPNKEKGPPKNLRPLNLLNTMGNILSMITMKRIKSKVEIMYHKVNRLTDLIDEQQI